MPPVNIDLLEGRTDEELQRRLLGLAGSVVVG